MVGGDFEAQGQLGETYLSIFEYPTHEMLLTIWLGSESVLVSAAQNRAEL